MFYSRTVFYIYPSVRTLDTTRATKLASLLFFIFMHHQCKNIRHSKPKPEPELTLQNILKKDPRLFCLTKVGWGHPFRNDVVGSFSR